MMQQAVPSARVSAFLNETGLSEQATYQVAFNGLAVEIGAADKQQRRVMRLPNCPA
jgi:hypothetical protein